MNHEPNVDCPRLCLFLLPRIVVKSGHAADFLTVGSMVRHPELKPKTPAWVCFYELVS